MKEGNNMLTTQPPLESVFETIFRNRFFLLFFKYMYKIILKLQHYIVTGLNVKGIYRIVLKGFVV